MRAMSFGSLNIDRTYRVSHVVAEGETLTTQGMSESAGGKGLNQAIALAAAGLNTSMGGQIGADGQWLCAELNARGVGTDHVRVVPEATGHALIQLDDRGKNCIIVYPGANGFRDPEWVESVIDTLEPGDLVLLQNEIDGTADVIRLATARGVQVALNPSPLDSRIPPELLSDVDYLFVNEGEGASLAGVSEPGAILDRLTGLLPRATIVLTLGADGAWAARGDERFFAAAKEVAVVDTTGAGDTFTGYFLAALSEGRDLQGCLDLASAASAIAITRPGAAQSIPTRDEVENAR